MSYVPQGIVWIEEDYGALLPESHCHKMSHSQQFGSPVLPQYYTNKDHNRQEEHLTNTKTQALKPSSA